MKLLFDENLSPKLVPLVSHLYPESAHVFQVGLHHASDRSIWEYARARDFVIVTKDTDFRVRSILDGFPPKIIWLDVGNVGTRGVAETLERARAGVEAFGASEEISLLILSPKEETA